MAPVLLLPLRAKFTPLGALIVAEMTSLLSGSITVMPAKLPKVPEPTVVLTALPELSDEAVLAVVTKMFCVLVSKPSPTVNVICAFPELFAT